MTVQLASKSPRRRELLSQIGVEYRVVSVDVPEERQPGESPRDYVVRLAREKAKAGYLASPVMPTLGADTIVCSSDGAVLEKPQDERDFIRMMESLSGAPHVVSTAVCVWNDEEGFSDCSDTTVQFREISQDEMTRYWQTGEPQDKAGGYGIQGKGAVFIERIEGSYSGVVGLPIEVIVPLFKLVGIPVWNVES